MKRMILIGNVGREPVQRANAKGVEFFEFSIAVSDGDTAFWVSVILRGKSRVVEYITKGKQLYVDGGFSISVYKGEPSVTVYADNVQLLGGTTQQPTQEDTHDTF